MACAHDARTDTAVAVQCEDTGQTWQALTDDEGSQLHVLHVGKAPDGVADYRLPTAAPAQTAGTQFHCRRIAANPTGNCGVKTA